MNNTGWWEGIKSWAGEYILKWSIKVVERCGLTVVEIHSIGKADYIRASDGSWRKIGGAR